MGNQHIPAGITIDLERSTLYIYTNYKHLETVAQVDIDRLNLSIILQSILSQLTANSAVLESAERHLNYIITRGINPDTPSLQFPGNPVTTLNVLCED